MRFLAFSIFLVAVVNASFLRESRGSDAEVAGDSRRASTSPRPSVEELCRAKNEFLKKAYKARVAPGAVIQRALKSKAQVILFGESHSEPSSDFYKAAFRKMKKQNPRFDCVLVEQSEAKFSAVLRTCGVRKACERRRLPVFSGVNEALALGLKVFAVDAEPNLAAKDFLADVSRRNKVMAENAKKLFDSGQCHNAVMIVGSLHAHRDPRIESVGDLLSDRGVSQYRIELMSPGLDSTLRPDSRWIWTDGTGGSLCQEVAGPIGANFGFFNGDEAKSVISYYGPFSEPGTDKKEFSGFWGDYDAAVLLGCEKASVSVCRPYREQDYKLPNRRILN